MKFYIVTKYIPRVIDRDVLQKHPKNTDLILNPDPRTGLITKTLDEAFVITRDICDGEVYYVYCDPSVIEIFYSETDMPAGKILFMDTDKENSFRI